MRDEFLPDPVDNPIRGNNQGGELFTVSREETAAVIARLSKVYSRGFVAAIYGGRHE